MLCRVSCKTCHLSCLWTDDPKGFLESVCLRYRNCQAKLIFEGFDSPGVARRARSVTPRGVSAGKAEIGKLHHRRPRAQH
jgi:hypothetical protein